MNLVRGPVSMPYGKYPAALNDSDSIHECTKPPASKKIRLVPEGQRARSKTALGMKSAGSAPQAAGVAVDCLVS